MKKEWVTAIRSLSKKRPLAERTKKKVREYVSIKGFWYSMYNLILFLLP